MAIDQAILKEVERLKEKHQNMGSKAAFEYAKAYRAYDELSKELEACPGIGRALSTDDVAEAANYFSNFLVTAFPNEQIPEFHNAQGKLCDTYKDLLRTYFSLASGTGIKPVHATAKAKLAAACMKQCFDITIPREEIQTPPATSTLERTVFGDSAYDSFWDAVSGCINTGCLSSFARAVIDQTLHHQDVERNTALEYVNANTGSDLMPEERIDEAISRLKHALKIYEATNNFPKDRKSASQAIYPLLNRVNSRENRRENALQYIRSRNFYLIRAVNENRPWLFKRLAYDSVAPKDKVG